MYVIFLFLFFFSYLLSRALISLSSDTAMKVTVKVK